MSQGITGADIEAKAERQENAGHIFDAFDLYLDAIKIYDNSGNPGAASRLRRHLEVLLLKENVQPLFNYAAAKGNSAGQVESQARAARHPEGSGGSTELFERAARLREITALVYAVAGRKCSDANDPGGAADLQKLAAQMYSLAGGDHEAAAKREPLPRDEKEAKREYLAARADRLKSADFHSQAAYNFALVNELGHTREEEAAETAERQKADRDEYDSKFWR
ncbi:MAG: hypothetical protein JO128_09140 [Alphaproteobacteria bacterium]|nr:hypothetical protein [Alphaproteobacteria bacterium]